MDLKVFKKEGKILIGDIKGDQSNNITITGLAIF